MTIKSLLENLVKFIIKLRRPKTTKTSETITTDLERPKTIPSFTEQISDPVTEFSPAVIRVPYNRISELKPGTLWDSCAIMDTEDYPEILKYGRDIRNKLYNEPMYVLTLSKWEYANKKCPKNYNEKMLQQTGNYVHNTGRPRNFNNILVKIPISVTAPVYLVEIENSPEIQQLAKKLLPTLKKFGLHGKFDDIFLAFTKFTKSKIVTSDRRLILSHTQAQCENPINFQESLEKIMQPSPITVVLRERRNYYKNHYNPRWKKR